MSGDRRDHVIPPRTVVEAQPPHLPEDTLAYHIEVRILFQYGNPYRGKGMFIKTIWTDLLNGNVGPATRFPGVGVVSRRA